MLPLLCKDLNLGNIFLNSEDNMPVSISRFSRRVILQHVSEESLGLPAKTAPSQTFRQSYAYVCPEILQEKTCDLFLANTWSAEVILFSRLHNYICCDATSLQHILHQTQKSPVFPQRQPLPQAGTRGGRARSSKVGA
ncbi:Testis-specific serine/threonine-protein kinase 4 [Willisornis vidua]|uniref:Testis-specific serine/threonine-protein kinase 4 n=1 Tax=Willisornis vidua TaxID=1566151 RepID=A0ABQ9DIC0_9PASS|nr:Testis-specific serine/threonine-protein kinase 4 [Willisornis vidua]